MAEGVERFGECKCLAEPDVNGPWVRYSDYEKEKARADGHSRAYAEAIAERDRLDNRIGQLMRERSEAEAQRDQARQEVLEEVREEIEKRIAEQKRRIGMSSRETELRAMHGATILQNLLDYVTGHATLDPSGANGGERGERR